MVPSLYFLKIKMAFRQSLQISNFLISWPIKWTNKVKCNYYTCWKKKLWLSSRALYITSTRDLQLKNKKTVIFVIGFFLSNWLFCLAVIAIQMLQLVINMVEFAKSIIIPFRIIISFSTSMFAFKLLTKFIL